MKVLSIMFIILFSSIVYTQNTEWEHYTMETITSLIDDGSFIWATSIRGGVIKIDKNSRQITYFNKENSELPDDNVTAIAIDKNGNKWFGTWGGLAKFDNTNWTIYNVSNSGLPNNIIYAITIDTIGNLWIGTESDYINIGGLIKFDGNNWTVYNPSELGLRKYDIIYRIAIDANNNKWIGTPSDIVKFDGTNPTVYNSSNSGLPPTRFSNIAIDRNNNKWIGTEDGGIVRFDDTNWTVYNTSNSGLPTNLIASIAIDTNNNKWIGTDKGLIKFNGTDWTIYNTNNSELNDNFDYSVATDKDNNILIGSIYGDVQGFNGSSWITYRTSHSKLFSSQITCIEINNEGNKWIGTWGGGVSKYNDYNWSNFYQFIGSNVPPFNDVLSIAIDSNNNKWFGTYEEGLVKYDDTNWTVYNTTNSGLPSNNILSIGIDTNGDMWLGTWGGIVKYDNDNWTTFNNTLPYISSIAIDKQGIKWFGSQLGGVEEYNGTTFRFYFWNSNNPDFKIIEGIAVDKYNNKWFATDKGLVKYDGINWTIFDISNSGIPENETKSIVIDGMGNKWIGTAQGELTKFDGNNWTVYKLSDYNLPVDNLNSLAIDKNGDIWIGTANNGVIVYKKGAVVLTPEVPLLSSPVNNSKGISLTPTLIWNSVTAAETYNLQVSKNSSFSNLIKDINQTGASYNLSGLLDNTKYYWKVSATNTGGTSYYSSVWNLTTKLSTPTLTLPANNATDVSLSPTLSWSSVSGADKYKLEVNTKLDFTGTVAYDENTISSNSKQIGELTDNTKYYWRVTALNNTGNLSDTSSTFNFTTGTATGIDILNNIIPKEYSLSQNFPNPFNPTTTIRYALPFESEVKILIYNPLGQKIKGLLNITKSAGYHEITFNASNLPSGVYFYRIIARSIDGKKDFVDTKKLILIK